MLTRRNGASGNEIGCHAKKRNQPFKCHIKEKYHVNMISFKNAKMFVYQQRQKKWSGLVINYHPCTTRPLISASGQRQSKSEWIET